MFKVCLGLVVLYSMPLFAMDTSSREGPPVLAAPANAVLRDTQDQQVPLAHFRGKPAVLIYEDRHSVEVNRPFKDALRQRAGDPRRGQIQVVAVANVSSFNFFPARGFALHGVQDAERKARFPILIDWENALVQAPWHLPQKGSTILVLDPDGAVVWSRSGTLSGADQSEVFALLARLVPTALPLDEGP